MKKTLLLMVSAALVFAGVLTSCDKDDDDKTIEDTEETGGTGDENTGDENTGNTDEDTDGNTGETTDPDAPTFIWEANPNFDPCVVSYTESPDVKIAMNVPNGIAEFTCTISCDNEIVSSVLEAASIPVDEEIDLLYNDAIVIALAEFGVTCGVQLIGQTYAEFDLTNVATLARLVTMLYSFTLDFELEVTDAEGLSAKCKITLYTESD